MIYSIHSNPVSEHIPKYLYRYRSLDGPGLLNVERVLVHDEVYMTSPANLNDPFDCVVSLDFEAPDNVWHDYFKRLSQRKQPNLSENEHEIFALNAIKSGDYKNKEKHLQVLEGLQKDVNSTGIFCLTERNDCILMWSHYANCHKGICFEFAADTLDPLIGQSQRVNYLPFFQKAHIIDTPEAQVNRILLSKAKCWAYEAEWRKIDTENGYGLKYLNPTTLTGVILGCKISEPHQKSILEWVSNRNVPTRVYKAKQSPDGFRIEIEEL